MRRLFISYSRDDKHWVSELYRALREDYDAWMDKRITLASDWWERILTEIEDCDCVIYVMTPESVESIYCNAELDYALALNKPVLPLMLKSCNPPDALNRRRVQFQTIDDRMTLERITGLISRGLVGVAQAKMDGKYKAQTASRPPEPQANGEQIEETFRLAEEATTQQNDSLAEKLLQQVILKDPQGWGMQAVEQLVALRAHNVSGIVFAPTVRAFPPPPIRSRVYDILPAPFDWIDIRAGKVTLVNSWDDDSKVYLKKNQPYEFDVAAFAIGKYPVTNAQFAKFVEAKGYAQKKWWTDWGWQNHERERWTKPYYWTDTKRNQADYPVVGVSWYEAAAYCLWLSDVTGEKIMLPTEQQWQRAAQGDDKRAYPWGNDWDCQRCNNSVKPCHSNSTTPVTYYEGRDKGDSPFGVVDMAGNAWEWCLSSYYTGAMEPDGIDMRVMRGGVYDFDQTNYFRADFRAQDGEPNFRYFDGGFRFIRS